MPENAPNIFSTWVWEEARQERIRAHRKHGDTSMESQAPDAWRRYMILAEEVGEVAKEYNDADHEGRPVDLAKLRKELIQVAAMAGAWAAAIHTDAFDAYEYHHEVEDGPKTKVTDPWDDEEIVDFHNALLERAPDHYDGDTDQSEIILRYVRDLEAVRDSAVTLTERLACDHVFDSECGRCEWMLPFRCAIAQAMGATDDQPVPPMLEHADWRAEALKCRRIIKALPHCLTPAAMREVHMHLSAGLGDDEAAAEYAELVGWHIGREEA